MPFLFRPISIINFGYRIMLVFTIASLLTIEHLILCPPCRFNQGLNVKRTFNKLVIDYLPSAIDIHYSFSPTVVFHASYNEHFDDQLVLLLFLLFIASRVISQFAFCSRSLKFRFSGFCSDFYGHDFAHILIFDENDVSVGQTASETEHPADISGAM